MKVWVIGRGFPTKRNMMLGSFEFDQAKMLAARGLDVYYPVVDLVSIRGIPRLGYSLRVLDGVKVFAIHLPLGIIFSSDTLKKMSDRLLPLLCKRIERHFGMPEIIHVHYPALFPFHTFEPYQNKGSRIIVTEHWSKVLDKTIEKSLLFNLQNYWKKCDAICCVGNSLRKSIQEQMEMPRHIDVVPNIYNPAFTINHNRFDNVSFLAVGRLIPGKQFDKIIAAFANSIALYDDARLSIAGNGVEYDNLARQIEECGLNEKVTLLGEISAKEMSKEMSNCSVLISYSNLETFCVPIVEAWATGKPVVASEASIFADDPDEQLGILVDSGRIETLEDALVKMYQNYSSYSPEWIHKYAENHFSEKVISDMLLEIYSAAIEGSEQA